jgi:uncharacterized membrane protein
LVTGMNDDGMRGGHPTNAHVIEGIQSLHDRLDQLEHIVIQRIDAVGGHEAVTLERDVLHRHRLPAWRRPTQGEARWQVALSTSVAIALQVAVPGRLSLISPAWVMPAMQGALLAGIVTANPHRINKDSKMLRLASLTLAGLITLANVWSVVHLVILLVQGGAGTSNPGSLLITGGAIWLTNIIAFALWYWEFDRGGPVARAHAQKTYPDFQFVQMTAPEMAPPEWEPAFADYLYLAFTNAAAFSPTDVMPLSRWAKLAMTLQSCISIVTVVLVVARAVNILK